MGLLIEKASLVSQERQLDIYHLSVLRNHQFWGKLYSFSWDY